MDVDRNLIPPSLAFWGIMVVFVQVFDKKDVLFRLFCLSEPVMIPWLR